MTTKIHSYLGVIFQGQSAEKLRDFGEQILEKAEQENISATYIRQSPFYLRIDSEESGR